MVEFLFHGYTVHNGTIYQFQFELFKSNAKMIDDTVLKD